MIVTDDFLFLHLHKSGGTFINKAIRKNVSSANRLGYHLPYRYLPDGYGDLPVLGSVRNPWAYYVSFCFFQANSRSPNFVHQIFSDQGSNDLETTIMNMADPQPDHFVLLKKYAPTEFVNWGVNLTKRCVDEMSCMTGGWYTRLFDRMYAGCEPHLMRVETLREDFLKFLAGAGLLNSEFERYVRDCRKQNESRHEHYSAYYGKTLEEAIGHADQRIIERFGYAFA